MVVLQWVQVRWYPSVCGLVVFGSEVVCEDDELEGVAGVVVGVLDEDEGAAGSGGTGAVGALVLVLGTDDDDDDDEGRRMFAGHGLHATIRD